MEFFYKVRTPDGKLREGTVDSPTMEGAVQGLQKQNLIIVSVKPIKEMPSIMGALGINIERIKNKDVVILSRQLATLFDAKIPVVKALRTLAEESEKFVIKKKLTQMLDDIEGGMSMSQAMERHTDLFSDFYMNMVRSGEESGRLDEVFIYLADHLERSYELRSKARGALTYPAFIMVGFSGVMMLMLTVIIPNIATIFEEADVELPIYTKIVLAVSFFARDYWVVFFVILAFSSAFGWRYAQTPAGKYAWSKFLISIPLIGPLNKKIYIARFSDNFRTLLSSGVPVIRSLQITADVVGNEVYKDIIINAIESVKGGSTIADAIASREEIPPLLTQMMRIGEQSGKLSEILESLSRFYTREVNNAVDNMVSLIEPVMIIVLGAGVGFLVASVLLPLYNITAAI